MGGGGDAGVGDGPAKAMPPLQDWTPGSLSSVSGPVTHRMVAEECDTLVREKHQASTPKWPKKNDPPVNVNRAWKGEMETLREPPSVQRKKVSTPRSGREWSLRKPEPQPGNSTCSQSPLARPERPSALRPRNHREVESGDDVSSGSEDERDRLEEGLTTLV